MTMLHFFSYLPLIEPNLPPKELQSYLQFLVNSLQFIDLKEFSQLSGDYSKDFTNLLNPIFRLLFYKFDDSGDKEDLNQVKNCWLEVTEQYEKRKVEMMPIDEEGAKGVDFKDKARGFIGRELKEPRHEYD